MVVLLITLLQWKPEDWSKDLALDSVHVHVFNSKLFLVWLIVYQHLLIIGKYILVIPKGSAQGFIFTTITAEAMYSNNITRSKKKFV